MEKNKLNPCCIFCNTRCIDTIKYGKLSETGGIYAHYFCVLLSSHISQSGKDDEGIEGFTAKDIKKEVAKQASVPCSYCRKLGATISCAHADCNKIFHLPCGLQEKSLSQFFGSYLTYCRKHRPRQIIPKDLLKIEHQCGMCLSSINFKTEIDDIIWATCCSRNMFMHRRCGQHYAFLAAVTYKCPNCKNRNKFVELSQSFGIFVPERDAQWEYDRAFDDQLIRNQECTQNKCYSVARDFNKINTLWELLMCEHCGSQGTHRFCSSIELLSSIWACSACTPSSSSKIIPVIDTDNKVPCVSKTCVSTEGRYFEDDQEFKKISCYVCKQSSVHRKCANVTNVWYCQLHEHMYKRRLIVKLEDLSKIPRSKWNFNVKSGNKKTIEKIKKSRIKW